MRLADSAKSPRKALTAGLFSLCLLMLSAQVVGLTHSHDSDLQRQYDCEICTKFGGSEDAAVDGKQALPLPPAPRFNAESGALFFSPPLLHFHSRAPPAG